MAKRKPLATSFAVAVKETDTPKPRRVFKTDRDQLTGLDPIIAEARPRWNKAFEAEEAQRTSILGAKKFRAGDQWPSAIKIQREGSSAITGIAAQPARPCLTIDRLSQPVRALSNQIKQAAFAINVLPNGFGATEEVGEILQGYFRRVQNEARTDAPVEWAADGAIEGGLGWFRLRTDYVYETWDGDPNDPAAYDQECKFERIANNLAVYCDPSAMKPTRSDALFMFVTEDLDRDTFTSRYPNANVDSLDAFMGTGDMSGWVGPDLVRIAEYWRITFTDVPLEDGQGNKRTLRKPKVECFKISATEVLEHYDWLGSRIPLIPILGEELNVDGKPVLRGVIQEGMDAQRMVNYTYSGAIEIFALGNKAPWKAATGAVDNYKEFWQNANTSNLSWLPWDAFDEQGRPMPEPKRENSEPPIEAAVALMLRSEEAIKATTGVYDPSLEYNNPREHSGEAIKALQGQSDLTGSNYPNHVARALLYAAMLMVEIVPKITRPGQILQIIGQDDEPEQVMAGVPFQKGADGRPMPLPEGHPFDEALHEFYDLKTGKYGVTVTVGKGSETRRQEGANALGMLIPHLPPEMAAVATPDYVEQLSFPGAHKIAEKLRKALPPQLQESEDGQPNPQQLQAENAQLKAQLQQVGQLADKNKTDLMKVQMQEQGDSQRADADRQFEMTKAELQATTTLGVAQAKADAENFRSYVDSLEAKVSAALDLHLQRVTHAHEAQQAQLDRTHEMVQTLIGHQQAMQQSQMGHQQALEQGQQAADLAPEPTAGADA